MARVLVPALARVLVPVWALALAPVLARASLVAPGLFLVRVGPSRLLLRSPRRELGSQRYQVFRHPVDRFGDCYYEPKAQEPCLLLLRG